MSSRSLPVFCLLLTGCLRLVTAPVPMKALEDVAAVRARCLIVFLPGVADRAQTFREQGFVDALRARHLSVDALLADATVGYYLRGVETRALDTVVAPAVARGYEQVWLVGVSMGGFGALHYAASFPSRFDGVLLLSPHLGEETVLQHIRDAGGLEQWEPPPPERFSGRNYTEDTWRWLKRVTVEGRERPQLWLGYAQHDVVTGPPLLLAPVLPRARVLEDEGGHSWAAWRRLWGRFLDGSDLGQRCATLMASG